MTQPAFRHATQSDVPALVALIERAYRGPETAGSWVSEAHLLKGPRTSEKEISDLIARPDSVFLIAEVDGQLAGCCLLQGLGRDLSRTGGSDHDRSFAVPGDKSRKPAPEPVNAAYFGMFAINPSIQGGGIGKAILSEAEKHIGRLWNANVMVMTVINLRTELIQYYERRGYKLTGATVPFPFSETSGETTRDFHLVEMRKDLRQAQ
ncbi:MAG TPA: GNAT family N-acetyltransferase [Hyphomonadaceae bacterium]|nr:GNAT family N-acetyltransferase [Hyphomonadaceae bacterium]